MFIFIEKAPPDGVAEYVIFSIENHIFPSPCDSLIEMFNHNCLNISKENQYNNKIKVIKRVSFGICSFDYFRNRTLHCTSLT